MIRHRSSPPLFLLLAALAPPLPAEAPAVTLPRLAAPPVIDGALDDPAWRGAAVVDRFWEFAPGDRAAPPVATTGYLAYDAEFLYVGVRCADPEPSALRAPYVERDHVANQDLVQVDVDARDEGRWSMIFRVNPRGVQADGVFDEAVGADDFSPDFHWESATRIDAGGWTAEMRIPLTTLRYRDGDPQSWRVTFFRLYPRKFRHAIASMPVPRAYNCWLCHATRFTGITGLGRGASLTVAPFVTAAGLEPAAGERDVELDAGADLKWLPRPNLSLDLAANPDFSQVESDAAQISANQRFALFYPEKRPFFLEGSDLWNSPIQAIHTRTITDPDWGARITGRPGNGSYTLLAAADRGGGLLVLPGAESSGYAPQPDDATAVLGRWRQTLGRHSVAALFTSREGAGGYFNRVAGADFQWYPTALDRATGQLLWSETRDGARDASGASTSATEGDHALFLRWERTAPRYNFHLQWDETGEAFRADSGFVPQVGVRHGQAYGEYSLFREGAIRQVTGRLYYDATADLDGRVISATPAVGVTVDGAFRLALEWYERDRTRALDGTLFEPSYAKLALRFLPGRRLPLLTVNARYGDEVDLEGSRLGTGAALGFAASIAPTDRLQAEIAAEERRLDLPAAGGRGSFRLFTAGVARAKLLYTFTARSFARAIGEWRTLDERDAGGAADTRFFGSLLYGYRLDWQSILYAGYDNRPAAADEARRDQQIFVKLSYAFRPRLGKRPAPPPAPARVGLDENPPSWFGVCPIDP